MNFAPQDLAITETNLCSPDTDSVSRFGDLLDTAILKLAELGLDFAPDEGKILFLKERLNEGRFHLAILGQFKRGKSTLLNAFLGEAILPTSVVPLTAIPTFVEYGQERKITIRFVRVAERLLINRSWTEPRCLGCSLEIMGKEY